VGEALHRNAQLFHRQVCCAKSPWPPSFLAGITWLTLQRWPIVANSPHDRGQQYPDMPADSQNFPQALTPPVSVENCALRRGMAGFCAEEGPKQ
jgi:hypothetical protein